MYDWFTCLSSARPIWYLTEQKKRVGVVSNEISTPFPTSGLSLELLSSKQANPAQRPLADTTKIPNCLHKMQCRYPVHQHLRRTGLPFFCILTFFRGPSPWIAAVIDYSREMSFGAWGVWSVLVPCPFGVEGGGDFSYPLFEFIPATAYVFECLLTPTAWTLSGYLEV